MANAFTVLDCIKLHQLSQRDVQLNIAKRLAYNKFKILEPIFNAMQFIRRIQNELTKFRWKVDQVKVKLMRWLHLYSASPEIYALK